MLCFGSGTAAAEATQLTYSFFYLLTTVASLKSIFEPPSTSLKDFDPESSVSLRSFRSFDFSEPRLICSQ